ncbi:MAG: TIGR02117 family protein [Flavobacteriales bacterium]|nr:TIGR02117 family protein [Flavobacteriales bacterium]
MKYIIKVAIFFLYSFEILTLFLSTYLTIALIGASFPINTDYNPENGEIEIFITSTEVHTDVCLPVETALINWTEFIDTKTFRGINQNPQFISIGWGDKGLFLNTRSWNDLSPSTAINAAFLPSSTAMHVTYCKEKPTESQSIKRCVITKEKYAELIGFIKQSFVMKPDNTPQLIPNAGYYPIDNFYEAKGSYYLFRTCNTWTNDALAIAGVRTSALALLKHGILRHL